MKSKKSKNYFTKETENAILLYLSLEDQKERDSLYREKIEYAFFKLTQNIIHTFKMYYTDGESIEDVQQDVIAFLLQKLHKYNPEKGAAYSYFGTIAKRYLILRNKEGYKKVQDEENLDQVDTDPKIFNEIINEADKADLNKFLSLYTRYMDKNLERVFPKLADAKTADAILELFRKRESLEIFNKKALYIYIREIVGIDTPQITKIIKKLKSEYTKLFNEYYEKDDIYIHD